MDTIKINGTDPIEGLKTLANELSCELYEEIGYGKLILTPKIGEGSISIYKISHRLSAFKFDLLINQEIDLQFGPAEGDSLDLIYCFEGSTKQRFCENDPYKHIGFRQNALINRKTGTQSFIKIASNTHLKISYLILNLSAKELESTKNSSIFRERAKNLDNILETSDNNRHMGRVCFRTAEYVKVIMEKSVNTISNVFLVEAAILNILASQIEGYQSDIQEHHSYAPIRPSEIDKIHSLHAFIIDNLSENLPLERLASLSGLSTAKLQIGFKYLYNTNVASYITRKRVELAARLMENGDMNISEIVYAIGFSSRSYFSKIFKRRFGVKPSDYIKREALTELA